MYMRHIEKLINAKLSQNIFQDDRFKSKGHVRIETDKRGDRGDIDSPVDADLTYICSMGRCPRYFLQCITYSMTKSHSAIAQIHS